MSRLSSEEKAKTDNLPEAVRDGRGDKESSSATQSDGENKCDTTSKPISSPAACEISFQFPLSDNPPMDISNALLFYDVFEIREVDHRYHLCCYLDTEGARCKSAVSSSQSFGIKLIQRSIANTSMYKPHARSLAAYNLCEAHKAQSEVLLGAWLRLAETTKSAREYWLEQAKAIPTESADLSQLYTDAKAYIRRCCTQDQIWRKGNSKEGGAELAIKSGKVIDTLRDQVVSLQSQAITLTPGDELPKSSLPEDLEKISALEKQVAAVMAENSSLRTAKESAERRIQKREGRHPARFIRVSEYSQRVSRNHQIASQGCRPRAIAMREGGDRSTRF